MHTHAFSQSILVLILSVDRSAKSRKAAPSFRLWLLCHWPDTYLMPDNSIRKGVRVPCRIPLTNFPGTLTCAQVAYAHAPMPVLIGKHALEITSGQAFIKRAAVGNSSKSWTLIEKVLGAFQAQVEVRPFS